MSDKSISNEFHLVLMLEILTKAEAFDLGTGQVNAQNQLVTPFGW